MSTISKNTSNDMGSLLLKGWAMLAEVCPACQVPLMRNPKTKERLCVSCSNLYTAEDPLNLKEEIPKTNLSDSNKQNTVEVKVLNSIKKVTSTNISPSDASADSKPHVNTSTFRVAKSESVDASSLISDKLLQGWAMLESCCPRCSTILVRDKQRRVFCVLCNAQVVTESQYQEATASNAAGKEKAVEGWVGGCKRPLSEVDKHKVDEHEKRKSSLYGLNDENAKWEHSDAGESDASSNFDEDEKEGAQASASVKKAGEGEGDAKKPPFSVSNGLKKDNMMTSTLSALLGGDGRRTANASRRLQGRKGDNESSHDSESKEMLLKLRRTLNEKLMEAEQLLSQTSMASQAADVALYASAATRCLETLAAIEQLSDD